MVALSASPSQPRSARNLFGSAKKQMSLTTRSLTRLFLSPRTQQGTNEAVQVSADTTDIENDNDEVVTIVFEIDDEKVPFLPSKTVIADNVPTSTQHPIDTIASDIMKEIRTLFSKVPVAKGYAAGTPEYAQFANMMHRRFQGLINGGLKYESDTFMYQIHDFVSASLVD